MKLTKLFSIIYASFILIGCSTPNDDASIPYNPLFPILDPTSADNYDLRNEVWTEYDNGSYVFMLSDTYMYLVNSNKAYKIKNYKFIRKDIGTKYTDYYYYILVSDKMNAYYASRITVRLSLMDGSVVRAWDFYTPYMAPWDSFPDETHQDWETEYKPRFTMGTYLEGFVRTYLGD